MSRGLYLRLAARAILVAVATALASACSSGPPAGSVSRPAFSESEYGAATSPRVATRNIRKGGGSYKLGSPYKVAGRWYVPHENPNYVAYGVASWYGADFHGRQTANGEVFDAHALTAAHPTMPLPSYAIVTNMDNGKSVLVRVNDRGPYVNDRVIDMSYASAKALGYVNRGRARVKVQYAGRAPLNGDDSRERRYLAEQGGQRQYASRPGYSEPRKDLSRFALAPARDPASTRYADAAAPEEASGRWSPLGYRSALTGKAPSEPRVAPNRPIETASFETNNRGRMSLTAPPSDFRPFARARTYIQIGLFRDRSNAERLRRDLGTLGPIEVAPVQVADGSQAYRVRMGPFSPDAANQTQNRIAALGVADTAIVTD